MKTETIAFIYLVFGIFFFFMGISMFGISGTVEPNPQTAGVWSPISVLVLFAVADMAVSSLFLALTLRFFRAELFGEELPKPNTLE